MTEIFGIPTQALFGQLLIGLINGSFYALLSLGLAVIFGLLNIINFTHGAQYMMGAFCAYFLSTKLGIGYWWALAIAPLAVGLGGMVIERGKGSAHVDTLLAYRRLPLPIGRTGLQDRTVSTQFANACINSCRNLRVPSLASLPRSSKSLSTRPI